MRFLILTQYYPPEIGAAQTRLAAFAAELKRAKHEIEVVTALPNYPEGRLAPEDRRRISRRETIDGIPVRRLWLYPASGAGARRLASYLSFSFTGLLGAGARRPDVVFVESPPLFLGVTGWFVARRFGARFVLNVSDLWPDSLRDLGMMRDGAALRSAERLERWLYDRADAVTAVTAGIRDRLIEAKGLPAAKVLYLPNGVDTSMFRYVDADPLVRQRHGLPDGPIAMFTGNHGYAQALDTVVLAAGQLTSASVVLVGAGSDKARVQRLAADRSITNVSFVPPVPASEIAGLYAHATAGLTTLRGSALMEGAKPAKTLAIMACGRPVIYSGSGEGAQLVRDADAGVVVPPEDPGALAAAIERLVADPAEAARLGDNGRRYVEANLGWKALVDSWLSQLSALGIREPTAAEAPPPGRIAVRDALASDVPAILPVHRAAFAGSLNGRLGRPYAVALLRWFVESDAIAVVATRGLDVVGYVVGAREGYGRGLTRRTLPGAVIGAVLNPRLALEPRFRQAVQARARAVLGRGGEASGTEPLDPERFHLVALGVDAAARGAGIGRMLVDAFEARARAAGARTLSLTVYPDNGAAIRLYESAGWARAEGVEGPAGKASEPVFLVYTKELG